MTPHRAKHHNNEELPFLTSSVHGQDDSRDFENNQ